EQRSFAGLARASGKVVSWAPLLDNPFAPGSAQQIIAEAAELQARGVQVVPQVGCRPLEVRFDFTEPAFYLEQNPFWRPIMAKSRDERRRLFADAEFRAELCRQTGFVAALAQGWDRLVLRLAASEGVRRWQDRSVAEIAAAEGGALRAPRPGPPRPRLRRRPGALRSGARRHAPDRDGVRPAARAAPPPPARRGHNPRAGQRHPGGRGRRAHRPPPRPRAARGGL